MVVVCEECGARFHLDSALLKDSNTARIRCRKCGGLFVVRFPEESTGSPPPVPAAKEVVPKKVPASAPRTRREEISLLPAEENLAEVTAAPGPARKVTYAEFEKLILLSDRMILSCVPRKSEYWRGYNSGIKIHFQNGQQESFPDYYFIVEIARRDGSRDVHAYARGYRDGCKGLIPENTP